MTSTTTRRTKQISLGDAELATSPGAELPRLPLLRSEEARAPLERLCQAVDGGGEVRREDLQALLVGHLLDANALAKVFGSRLGDLMEMLFKTRSDEADPGATLRLVARLSSLYGEQLRELRRTAELLHRMSCPAPPTLQVVNATQITVGERTRNRSVGLGEGHRARR